MGEALALAQHEGVGEHAGAVVGKFGAGLIEEGAAHEDGAAVDAPGGAGEFPAGAERGLGVQRGGVHGVEECGEIASDEAAHEGERGIADEPVEDDAGGAGGGRGGGLQEPVAAGETHGEIGGPVAAGGLGERGDGGSGGEFAPAGRVELHVEHGRIEGGRGAQREDEAARVELSGEVERVDHAGERKRRGEGCAKGKRGVRVNAGERALRAVAGDGGEVDGAGGEGGVEIGSVNAQTKAGRIGGGEPGFQGAGVAGELRPRGGEAVAAGGGVGGVVAQGGRAETSVGVHGQASDVSSQVGQDDVGAVLVKGEIDAVGEPVEIESVDAGFAEVELAGEEFPGIDPHIDRVGGGEDGVAGDGAEADVFQAEASGEIHASATVVETQAVVGETFGDETANRIGDGNAARGEQVNLTGEGEQEHEPNGPKDEARALPRAPTADVPCPSKNHAGARLRDFTGPLRWRRVRRA